MFGFVVLLSHMFLYFIRGLRFRVRTMNFSGRRFNLYFLLTVALALGAGCATGKKDSKQTAALRVHIECSANIAPSGQTVLVLRSQPVQATVTVDPILTEANIAAAKLIDTPGGFAVELKFDSAGTRTLEQYSSSNPGKHLVIFGQWGLKSGDGRWLAAPIIGHRIGTGVLAFSVDASRDEAMKLVLGLNNNAAKMAAKKF